MCNDFGNRVPYDDYLRAFSQSRAPIKFPTAALNLEPRDDIWPTDPAIVIRRREDGVELVQLRWGFPKARGRSQFSRLPRRAARFSTSRPDMPTAQNWQPALAAAHALPGIASRLRVPAAMRLGSGIPLPSIVPRTSNTYAYYSPRGLRVQGAA
jgi:hypothetical protein